MLSFEIYELGKVTKIKVLPGDNESPSGGKGCTSVCDGSLSGNWKRIKG